MQTYTIDKTFTVLTIGPDTEREHSMDVRIEYQYTPYDPGVVWGPNAQAPEGEYIEIVSIKLLIADSFDRVKVSDCDEFTHSIVAEELEADGGWRADLIEHAKLTDDDNMYEMVLDRRMENKL